MWTDEAAPRLASVYGTAGVRRRVLKVGGLPRASSRSGSSPSMPPGRRFRSRSSRTRERCSSTSRPAGRRRRRRSSRPARGGLPEGARRGHLRTRRRHAGRNVARSSGAAGRRSRWPSRARGTRGARLTEVPGPRLFLGSAVTYANSAKAGIAACVWRRCSASARLRGDGARDGGRARLRFGATIALAVTGIAGPRGDGREAGRDRPHGLDAADGTRLHRRHLFPGTGPRSAADGLGDSRHDPEAPLEAGGGGGR